MLLALLLAQAAAPDIEIQARVTARSLTIDKRGDAHIAVRSDPEGRNIIDIRAPRANGRKTLRNVAAEVRAEARIVAGGDAGEAPETSRPQ